MMTLGSGMVSDTSYIFIGHANLGINPKQSTIFNLCSWGHIYQWNVIYHVAVFLGPANNVDQ